MNFTHQPKLSNIPEIFFVFEGFPLIFPQLSSSFYLLLERTEHLTLKVE